nr:MAG TPA: hypothetical protein [Bacteriophage sp.]
MALLKMLLLKTINIVQRILLQKYRLETCHRINLHYLIFLRNPAYLLFCPIFQMLLIYVDLTS